MTSLPRRRLLAASGTALAVGVAGCSGDGNGDGNGDESDEEGPDDPEPTDTESSTDVDGTILGEITVDNSSGTSRTVDVIAEFDREIEAWETVNLSANEDATLERDWPTEPGQFRVTARLDGETLVQATPENWNDPDCLNLLVRIDRDGALQLHGNTDGGPCGDGGAEP